MKKEKRAGIIIILILGAIILSLIAKTPALKEANGGKIDNQVSAALINSKAVKVIVILKDSNDKVKNRQIRENAKKMIGNERIKHDYDSMNAFSATLTELDIQKLIKDENILSITYDKEVHVFLSDSVNITDANTTWLVKSQGVNLTGRGETVCVIDTGIKYNHADFGCNPQVLSLNGTESNNVTQSAHNYIDNFDYTWTIQKTGYSNIALHFVNLSTEETLDFVSIYDGSGRIVARYSGDMNNFWTPSVTGDTIKVRLTSDESANSYGFYIDKVINGTTNMTYNWSNCSKVAGGWNMYSYGPNPMDDHGHGTHVSGIVAANGGIKGIAPEARIFALKALGANGRGSMGDIAAGIEYCVNKSAEFNISAISMSLGSDCWNATGWTGNCYNTYCDNSDYISQLVAAEVNRAVAKNISVVAATGNDGNESYISSPACIQNITRVSSTAKNDNVSNTANRGAIVNLFATGVSITSTYNDGGYATMSGTSMAAPHVAGAIAIINQYLRSNGETKTPREIELILNSTGQNITDYATGRKYSRINIFDAIYSLDITAPEIQVNRPLNNSWNNGFFNVTISESGSCWYSIGSASNKSMNSSDNRTFYSSNSTLLQGQNYNITYYCNDSRGYMNQTLITFRADLTLPNVTLTDPLPASSTASSVDQTFYYNVSDNLNISSCALFINGGVARYNSTLISNLTNNITYNLSPGSFSASINCSDEAGNTQGSNSTSFTITAPVSQSSGGGSSRGGGGGGATSITNIIYLTQTQLGSGYERDLRVGDKVIFGINNGSQHPVNHTLIIRRVNNDSAIVEIQSNPFNITLSVGEYRKLNMTDNAHYDLFIKLEQITNRTFAKLTLRGMNELILEKKPMEVSIQNTTDNSEENINNTNSVVKNLNIEKKIKGSTVFLIMAVMMTMVLGYLLMVLMVRNKRDREVRERLQKNNKLFVIKR